MWGRSPNKRTPITILVDICSQTGLWKYQENTVASTIAWTTVPQMKNKIKGLCHFLEDYVVVALCLWSMRPVTVGFNSSKKRVIVNKCNFQNHATERIDSVVCVVRILLRRRGLTKWHECEWSWIDFVSRRIWHSRRNVERKLDNFDKERTDKLGDFLESESIVSSRTCRSLMVPTRLTPMAAAAAASSAAFSANIAAPSPDPWADASHSLL